MMDSTERYARQTMLREIGPEGQRRLAGASVLVVGVGGLGSPAALYLTGAGVGRLGLADPDRVSESNLQRQTLYTESQIGRPKTEAARERLAALSSQTRFECYPAGLTAENAREVISRYDLVVDCCDNFPTRYLIDDACAECGKPWVHGSIGEFQGQVALFNGRSGAAMRSSTPTARRCAPGRGLQAACWARCRESSVRSKPRRPSSGSSASANRSTDVSSPSI